MGCFFACFRVRDDRRPIHLLSQPITSNPKNPAESVARNHLPRCPTVQILVLPTGTVNCPMASCRLLAAQER
ncbi:hypothetical protein L2E82_11461 [Cichorium intybus]|uniref:Uncharacterized protein n=1 Tax=Cichorium intybus TaxID=13427 RepID=A0ACB9GE01_CICIN|nr:hypothetical protein L2E82_11461 [Cichorium intybus]